MKKRNDYIILEPEIYITNNKNILKNSINDPVILKCANNTYCDFEGYGEYDFKVNRHYIKLKRVLYSKDVAKSNHEPFG